MIDDKKKVQDLLQEKPVRRLNALHDRLDTGSYLMTELATKELSQLFDASERQQLRQLAAKLAILANHVGDLRDQRRAGEAAATTQLKSRQFDAESLTIKYFPLPTESLTQKLDLVTTALGMAHAHIGVTTPEDEAQSILKLLGEAAGAVSRPLDAVESAFNQLARETREKILHYVQVGDLDIEELLYRISTRLDNVSKPAVQKDYKGIFTTVTEIVQAAAEAQDEE